MIERHALPSVLLNHDCDIVHLSPGAGRYMRVPGGEPTANVFKLVREELRLELRTALHTAEREHRSARTEPVVLDLDGQLQSVVVEIWPAKDPRHDGLSLLVFEEHETKQLMVDALATAQDVADGAHELRDDLHQTKHRLQGLIEKYETGQEEMRAANEELQSANEELRSTMEELETSKEELQSMNEELSTLNQENRDKVEELSEMLSDLENLMAATNIPTLFLDRELRILRFTPQVAELFNVRITDYGRPLTDLTHRLTYDDLGSDARKVLERLAPIEREIEDEDGRWYLARLSPYRAAHHVIGGIVITLFDISELKKAEFALLVRAETDAFRLKLTDAIRPLVDPLAIQSTASRLLGEYFGASRVFYAELIPDRAHGEIRTSYHKGVADVTGDYYYFDDHGPTLVNELRTDRTVIVTNVDEDPRLGPAERARARELEVAAFVTVPVIKSARELGVLVVQQSEPRNWTPREVALMQEAVERMWTTAERVQADSLRESEERYRTLFESINDGFCIIEVLFDDDDEPVGYRFVEVNAALEATTGIAEAGVRYMREITPDHEAEGFDIYVRVARTGESAQFEAEAKALGRYFYVDAVRVGESEQRRVAISFKDISERKRLEDKLSESNRRKDEFLATLAHELRNPLAPITNALALLRHPVKQERVVELHGLIERQVRHLVRLVDDLLDVSRITRGLIELRKQPVNLEEVVRTALEASRPHIERGQRGLSVRTQSLFVDGDATRLVQIVSNLLNNAAKFTNEHGQIWLKLSREGERARLSVRDDGVGISANMLSKVFDMFTQVDPTQGNGLGIGLTLVRSLVGLHGGSVEVRSEGLGHGSEFIVYLPLCAAANPSAPDETAAAEPKVAYAVPVLVIDDNRDAADSLALLLEVQGVEVQVAYDGPSALAICHDWMPTLVFLDLQLPDMDGTEIARALRKLPGGQSMVIIALTGASHAKDRQRTHEAGFDRHLLKPVQPEALTALLAEHCQ